MPTMATIAIRTGCLAKANGLVVNTRARRLEQLKYQPKGPDRNENNNNYCRPVQRVRQQLCSRPEGRPDEERSSHDSTPARTTR